MSQRSHARIAAEIARKHGLDQSEFMRIALPRTQNARPAAAKPAAARQQRPRQNRQTQAARQQGGLSLEAIQRFIPANSPLARAGGAQMLLRATGGNLAGAAFLAALARKESSYGAQAFAPNNFWGWGVHLGPSVNTAPSVEAMASRVWRGLSGNLYRGSGLVTPSAIINRYAPPNENNTSLYQHQVNQWFREMGLSPNTNIFSGGYQASGAGVPPPAPAPGGAPSVTRPSIDGAKLLALLSQTSRGALQGQMPGPQFSKQLYALAQDATRAPSVPQVQRAVARDAQARIPGADQFSGTYGFPTGGVDSGRVVPGGAGGDWGGSMPRALHLAKAIGAPISSQKRSRQGTASGGVSDHWQGSSTSYAVDLPYTGAAGDSAFRKTMGYLAQVSGKPELARLAPGRWHNINVGGYRYQVGWRVPGHFDHVHVGIKKL